uniref:Uncharacterized protein n=1 Tax=Glossina austeni TaxID=7395 RepID=A0A1A9VB22_GLOAU
MHEVFLIIIKGQTPILRGEYKKLIKQIPTSLVRVNRDYANNGLLFYMWKTFILPIWINFIALNAKIGSLRSSLETFSKNVRIVRFNTPPFICTATLRQMSTNLDG